MVLDRSLWLVHRLVGETSPQQVTTNKRSMEVSYKTNMSKWELTWSSVLRGPPWGSIRKPEGGCGAQLVAFCKKKTTLTGTESLRGLGSTWRSWRNYVKHKFLQGGNCLYYRRLGHLLDSCPFVEWPFNGPFVGSILCNSSSEHVVFSDVWEDNWGAFWESWLRSPIRHLVARFWPRSWSQNAFKG